MMRPAPLALRRNSGTSRPSGLSPYVDKPGFFLSFSRPLHGGAEMRKTFIVALLAALVFTVAGLSIAAEMGDQGGRMSDQDMVKSSQEHMKQMGMSEGMQMRHKMCMSGKMGAYDPAGLMAIKDDLKLTDEQATRLQAISDKAQQDAKAVLTAEQQSKMQQVEGTPETAAGMHKEMSDKMGGKCPMMGGAMPARPPECWHARLDVRHDHRNFRHGRLNVRHDHRHCRHHRQVDYSLDASVKSGPTPPRMARRSRRFFFARRYASVTFTRRTSASTSSGPILHAYGDAAFAAAAAAASASVFLNGICRVPPSPLQRRARPRSPPRSPSPPSAHEPATSAPRTPLQTPPPRGSLSRAPHPLPAARPPRAPPHPSRFSSPVAPPPPRGSASP